MADLVRAESTESIPEADPTPEYDVVPNTADYILKGGKMKGPSTSYGPEQLFLMRNWYKVFRQYKDFMVE